jgi:hypothetical protein
MPKFIREKDIITTKARKRKKRKKRNSLNKKEKRSRFCF